MVASDALALCCRCRHFGDERLADLRCLALLSFLHSQGNHARRLAGRGASMAFRGDVAAGGQRSDLPVFQYLQRPPVAQVFPAVAAGHCRRPAGRAERQAIARRPQPLQRLAAGGLPVRDRRHHRDCLVRPGAVEVRAVSDLARAARRL